MSWLNLVAGGDDDVGFVELADAIMAGVVAAHRPAEVLLFKVDGWFDHKWAGFSGKVLGAVGVWLSKLTVPPFVPNRIVGRRRFVRDGESGAYQVSDVLRDPHHRGPAVGNLHRRVKTIAPEAALFWYSGGTLETGRGSLMGYVPVEDKMWVWFLAFERRDGWRVRRRKGIHEYEVKKFIETGGRGVGFGD